MFLDRPKYVKARKAVTSRIVTKEDIKNVLELIREAEREGRISSYRALQYTVFVLFGAFTGQRSMATISRLNVGQFKTAAKMERPVLQVLSYQDKIRMEHYCPLHPQIIAVISPLLDGRGDNELMFAYNSL
jgi:integrase